VHVVREEHVKRGVVWGVVISQQWKVSDVGAMQ